jgi:16S rRNA (cytosine967-C5)-methyltransferase
VLRTSSKGASSRLQAFFLMRGSSRRLPLSPPDRAFAERISREAVVWRKYLDHVLGLYSRPSRSGLDEDILCWLRIGAVQLLVLGTPPHAAVSATVEAHGPGRTRGLLNAVLRKVADHTDDPDLPLHIRYSHPRQLVARWVARYGRERTEALCAWNNSPPDLGGYSFNGDVPEHARGRYLENYCRMDRSGRLKPGGGIYIQDESAALVGRGMASLPGGLVLEVGAAPGGKTAHLAGRGFTVSMDRKQGRLGRWRENQKRMGWEHCCPVAGDSSALPFNGVFEKVIVDAPCTNTGVYRRRTDARWNWSVTLEDELVLIQRKMLLDSSRAVKPDGILIYSTCSLEPEENTGAVEHFEANTTGFSRIPFPGPKEFVGDCGCFSVFPPDACIDGLFAAAWRRDRGGTG